MEWQAFHAAFVPPHQDLCRNLNGPRKKAQFWNFGQSMKLDQMLNIMASGAKIVEFTGNSNRDVPFYKPEIYQKIFIPSSGLEEEIPWKEPPECVVQLRMGDGPHDKRPGLDEVTLRIMEKELDRDCYLITNHLAWYRRFEEVGWGHPPWGSVKRHQGSASTQVGAG